MEGGVEADAGLKLFGLWASPFVHRVQLALRLKGLTYEYAEEDLHNKSPTLLLLNPVHRAVPVLLHGGRPISESVVILEYIDETWRERYPLMPSDPTERAVVRFWCHFVDNKLCPQMRSIIMTTGEEQKAAAVGALGLVKMLEDELRDGVFRGRKFFGGDRIGFLDVVIGCVVQWLDLGLGELAEKDVVKEERDREFPFFDRWLCDFLAQPEVEEIVPTFDKLREYVRGIRLRLNLTTKLKDSDHEEKKP